MRDRSHSGVLVSPTTTGSRRGFTLTEVAITVAVLAILTGPLVVVFHQSQASFQAQTQQAELVQQMRIAMDQIVRCIRQAGNQPVAEVGAPLSILGSGHIRLASDLTGSVASVTGNPADSTGDPDGELNSLYEIVTFRHSGQERRIFADIGYGEAVLAEGILSLDFLFFDLEGNETTDPDAISMVQVRITGETRNPDMQRRQPYAITLQSDVFIRSRTPQVLP
jgi:prepilin-type N-terminal cleavage/methylation domain-containing protein